MWLSKEIKFLCRVCIYVSSINYLIIDVLSPLRIIHTSRIHTTTRTHAANHMTRQCQTRSTNRRLHATLLYCRQHPQQRYIYQKGCPQRCQRWTRSYGTYGVRRKALMKGYRCSLFGKARSIMRDRERGVMWSKSDACTMCYRVVW